MSPSIGGWFQIAEARAEELNRVRASCDDILNGRPWNGEPWSAEYTRELVMGIRASVDKMLREQGWKDTRM